jgi:hypothetical protein
MQERERLGNLLDAALAAVTWTEQRDLTVSHPELLTGRAARELDCRAAAIRQNGDEGRALDLELPRDTLAAVSGKPTAALPPTSPSSPPLRAQPGAAIS